MTLQPAIGPERALVLAIASRMWLVSLEIIGAATVVGADWVIRRRQGFRITKMNW